jgi:RsiW-degrading membrane proteinase PrsW (M82 family)
MEQPLWTTCKKFIESKSLWVGFLLLVLLPSALVVLAVNLLGREGGTVLSPEDEANQYALAGNLERAENKYRELLKTKPYDIEYHRKFLESHFAQPKVKGQHSQRDDEGITKYYTDLAASDDSAFSDIGHYGSGLIHSFLNERDEAIADFSKISNQRLPYYNNSYGYCLWKTGEREKAEQSFRREIEVGANLSGAVGNLATLYLERGQYDKILTLLADPRLKEFVPESVQRATLLSRQDYASYVEKLVENVLSRTTIDGFLADLVILVIWFFYFVWIDIFEPEQLRYLILTLVLGMLSSFLCVLLYDWFNYGLGFRMNETLANDLLYCIFAVGLIEESVKILPLLILVRYTKLLNEPIDFLIYAAMSALGFAFMENLLYFNPAGVSAISGRALTAVVAHMALSSVAAYGLMLSRRPPDQKQHPQPFLVWFSAACVAHGLYDFLLSGRGPWEELAPFAIFLLFYLVIVYGRMLNNSLNISSFFSEHDATKLHNLGRFLTYTLSYLLLVQYLIIAARYGVENANLSVLRATIGSIGLIMILTISLSRFKLEKNKLLPLFKQVKPEKARVHA